MFQQNKPASMQQRIEIKKINLFQSVGTTDNVIRPTSFCVNNQTLAAAAEATRGGTDLSRGSFTQVAPQIMLPAGQHEGLAHIANGWATPRLVFVMEVDLVNEYTNTRISYIANGYTDHGDVRSYSGHMQLPRDMRLYFNNCITTATRQEHNPNGVFNVTKVVGSDQILRPNLSTLAQGQGVPGVQEQTLRPQDLFMSAVAADAVLNSGMAVHNYTAGFDVAGVKLANRSDHIASQFLSRSVRAYGKVASGFGDQYTMGDVASDASAETNVNLLTHNRFLDILSNRYDFNNLGSSTVGTLSWAEVLDIDPSADQRAQITVPPMPKQHEMQAKLREASNWGAATQEAIGANIVTSVVPTLLCNAMAGSVEFRATNMTFDRSPLVNIVYAAPLVDNLNITHLLPAMQEAIATDILLPISANGMMDVVLTVKAFLYGESQISISINGGPAELFVSATYADQLFNNLVTNNSFTPIKLGSDLVALAHELTQDNTTMFVDQMGQNNAFRI